MADEYVADSVTVARQRKPHPKRSTRQSLGQQDHLEVTLSPTVDPDAPSDASTLGSPTKSVSARWLRRRAVPSSPSLSPPSSPPLPPSSPASLLPTPPISSPPYRLPCLQPPRRFSPYARPSY